MELEEHYKKFKNRKTYTWEELWEFEKKGIFGQVCMCKIYIANTMTVECLMCGKILPQYAKKYIKRDKVITHS